MYEETFVLLKPDALEQRLVGKIVSRFEDSGLDILDIRYFARIGEELLRRHYPDSMALGLGRKAQSAVGGIGDPVAHGMVVLGWLRRYVSRGPVIAIRIGGEEAIGVVRGVTGYTDPTVAEKGTIRGDYGVDSLKRSTEEGRACENLVHASGNADEAKAELELWFPKREMKKV